MSSDLVVFPCSASKNGARLSATLKRTRVSDLVGVASRQLLEEGRRLAFQRRRTWIDQRSDLVQALALYTGNPYKVDEFRAQILRLLGGGTHCLILSGGYGLVRPEEPIHDYGAHMSVTAPVWRRRLPFILDDYIRRNRIGRVFVGCSSVYRQVLGGAPWGRTVEVLWCVPKARRGEAALVAVPTRVGEAFVRLVNQGMEPGRDWQAELR